MANVPLETQLEMSLDDVIEKSGGFKNSHKKVKEEEKGNAAAKDDEDEAPQFPAGVKKALRKIKSNVPNAAKAVQKAKAKGIGKGAGSQKLVKKTGIARMAFTAVQRNIPTKGKGQSKGSNKQSKGLVKRVIPNPIFMKRRQPYTKGLGKSWSPVLSKGRAKGFQRQPAFGYKGAGKVWKGQLTGKMMPASRSSVATYVAPTLRNNYLKGSSKALPSMSWGKGATKGGKKGGYKGGSKSTAQGKGGNGSKSWVINQTLKPPSQMKGAGKAGRRNSKGGSSKGVDRWDDRWDAGANGKASGRRGSKDGGAGFTAQASNNAKGKGGKGGKKAQENSWSGKAARPQSNAEKTDFTQSDRNMMKKITIVAQLDKVPKPPAAMTGITMNKPSVSSGKSASGPLSSRFGANFDR